MLLGTGTVWGAVQVPVWYGGTLYPYDVSTDRTPTLPVPYPYCSRTQGAHPLYAPTVRPCTDAQTVRKCTVIGHPIEHKP